MRDTRPSVAQESYLCVLGTYDGTRFASMGEVVLDSLHEAVEWIATPLRTVADRLAGRGYPEAREWLDGDAGPRRMTDRLLRGETYVLILSSEDQPVQWTARPVRSLPLAGCACLLEKPRRVLPPSRPSAARSRPE